MNTLIAPFMGWLGAVMVAAGSVALGSYVWSAPASWVCSAWARHLGHLDRSLRFVRARVDAASIGRSQVAVTMLASAAALATGWAPWLSVLPVVWVAPEFLLRRARATRLQQIEEALDTWLLVLANGLKAVPSLGDAMASSVPLIGGALAEELEVALHEYRLGSPLDVAARTMAMRVKSPVLTAAVTTLEVARRTGGALSETLEQAAASLREMARLQGVVRTKTAESKSQAWVISFVPAILLALFQQLCPDLIDVLFRSSRGHFVLALAALLWGSAIVAAMRILRVDT